MSNDDTTAEPPARRPWEEPPPAGYASGWQGVGVEVLRVLLCVVVAGLALRVAHDAFYFGPHRHGERHTLWLLEWGGAAALAVAVTVYTFRRLSGLFILGAMLTDYGRVARFGGRPPVWLDAPPPDPLRIAHLSDLHIVEGDTVRLVESARPGGNAHLQQLLDAPEVAESDLVVITGDITDRGTSLSWRCFLDAIEERGLGDRVVLVPGNHDLSFLDAVGVGQSWRHDCFGVVQLANLLKFGEAFAATAGGRRGSVFAGGQ